MMVRGERIVQDPPSDWGLSTKSPIGVQYSVQDGEVEYQILESRVNYAMSLLMYEVDLQIPWRDRVLRFEEA